MNIAIVSDTPYQVINVTNYVYHLQREQEVSVDLYLADTFHGFGMVYDRIKEFSLFDNIHVFRVRVRENTVLGCVGSVLQAVSPRYSIKKYLVSDCVSLNRKYDKILVNAATKMAVAMMLVFKDARVEYYDDGAGSYSRELSLCMLSRHNLLIHKLCCHNINRIVPQRILLNCPDMACETIKHKVVPLPPLREAPEELLDMFRYVWGYCNDGYYKKHRLVCLLSPNDANIPGVNAFSEDVQKNAPSISQEHLVRLHPRQKPEAYAGCCLDDHRDMWEMVCADQITEEHVLLADFSTAQMTPKMLYDIEPILICSYKAYSQGSTQERLRRIQELVDRLKASYRNKDRIIVPETPEELWECVKKYCADI